MIKSVPRYMQMYETKMLIKQQVSCVQIYNGHGTSEIQPYYRVMIIQKSFLQK